ncbi:hypothetical protein [Methylobacterium sp. UNC378MF]|uniref:hypothetical protein n=1 Tax=Methylobacterium sp. UNC378MF TaxID=1502748 RepID=UPI0011134CCE|nr:hypothetical protein [Methylobacterium sp. UNC378MF]
MSNICLRFAAAIVVSAMLISSADAEKLITCPTGKIRGCAIITDPLGQPAESVLCPISHCRVRVKNVDGQKVCKFTCPDYIIEPR